jgi:hypothetical protein
MNTRMAPSICASCIARLPASDDIFSQTTYPKLTYPFSRSRILLATGTAVELRAGKMTNWRHGNHPETL